MRTPLKRRYALLATALLACVVAAGATWWTFYAKSPEYSLRRLQAAAAHKDWPGVQRYVDLDAVILQQYQAAMPALRTGTSIPGGPLIARAYLTVLVRDSREIVRRNVARGIGPEGFIWGPLKFGDLGRVNSVDYSGDTAVATIQIPQPGRRPFDFRLKMSRSGDHWRVVGVENANAAFRVLRD